MTHTGNRQPATGNRGFTLIELLIVITLIMILAGIAMVQYRNSIVATEEAVLQTNLTRMRDAIDQYYADKGRYPVSLETLVAERYIREIPIDPTTKSNTTWVTTMAEPDPSSAAGGPGIYDVKSGSDKTALNGTRYSSW